MEHHMHLDKEPFEMIKSGSKNKEIRINDEKRQRVKVGDIIEFENRSNDNEKILTEVLRLESFDSYEEVVEKIPLNNFTGIPKTKEEAMAKGSCYDLEEEKKYGFVVFDVKVI